nr:YodL domain-containing protein [uncultured Acetatifactor sp.]
MKNIYFRDGILIYYGNPAGYLSGKKVVLDSIFDKEEIITYLSEKENLAVEIRSGVYDRLAEGGGMAETGIETKGRRIRIYQLKQDSPLLMRFVSLAEREKRGFGQPQQKEYALVYEGEVDTFSLEDVWEKFGRRVPKDFEGHALSISDVVEFSEEEASRFFYVEPKGFAEIVFKSE